jgi:hypothetical protein
MKQFTKTFLKSLGILLLLTSHAWASGRGAGNGGDAVVCRNASGAIHRIELLDYYEARTRGIAIEVGAPGAPLLTRVQAVIDRIAPHSPQKAQEYRERATSFMANTKFIHGHDLIDIPDSDGGSVPAGCKLEQIAVQRTGEMLPGDKLYTIDGDLWDALPIEDQVGLILHEIIYGDSIATVGLAEAQPRGVRYLNGLLASSAESLNVVSMVAAFQAVRLAQIRWKTPHYELDLRLLKVDWHTKRLILVPVLFHADGSLKSAEAASEAFVSLKRNGYDYGLKFYPGTSFELDEEGFPIASPETTVTTSIKGPSFEASMRILEAYPDLSPKLGGSTLHFANSFIRAYAHLHGEMHFYPGYRLREIRCVGPSYSNPTCWYNVLVRVEAKWVSANFHLRVAESGEYLETCFMHPQTTTVNGQSFGVSCARVSQSAAIIRARGWSELEFKMRGGKFIASLSDGVERTEAGGLVSACLSKEASLSDAAGVKSKYPAGTRLEFGSDGHLRGVSRLPCALSFGDLQ